MRVAIMMLPLAFLLACEPARPPSAPVEWPATPEGACAHLEELGCAEAKPAADGTSCPMVIRKAQRLIDMNLACVVAATDVNELRTCGTVRCRE